MSNWYKKAYPDSESRYRGIIEAELWISTTGNPVADQKTVDSRVEGLTAIAAEKGIDLTPHLFEKVQ